MTKPFSNKALTAVCEMLVDEFQQTPEQIANLVKHIVEECKDLAGNRAEAAWERQQESLMESGGPDDSAYRRQMREAGRGHLLR